MYILEPYEQGEFKGWRTSLENVHRFYFTDAADSYAAAFLDHSAMGVIAVAVYPERQQREEPADVSRDVPPSARRDGPAEKSEAGAAGTGYGRREYDPARVVAFDPEGQAVATILIKYEWRSTLCRQGIVHCEPHRPPRNRLWDNGGFAPPPPGRS